MCVCVCVFVCVCVCVCVCLRIGNLVRDNYFAAVFHVIFLTCLTKMHMLARYQKRIICRDSAAYNFRLFKQSSNPGWWLIGHIQFILIHFVILSHNANYKWNVFTWSKS